MPKIWELYENMDEIVYVSNVNKHEIVYMNKKARELLGIKETEQVKGRKCYTTILNQVSPCDCCKSSGLKINEFNKYEFYNPVLNKTFKVNDTLIKQGHNIYMMEIALDITDIREQVDKLNSYVHNELIVNEALKIVLAWNDPLTSMEKLLEYVGKNYDCDRAYIFEETRKDIIDNTHEWCRQGVSAEKDNLQNIPKEDAKIWMDRFINNENIIVTNLDDVKLHDRVMYDYLYPQNITTLVVAPLVYENQIIGFFGVDNPPIYLMHNISKTFDILAGFIVSLLHRQQIYRELKELSYHDQLTGFDNRISYDKYVEELSNYSSVGIIFMDIVGLKITNDTYGHKAGDALIIKTCDIIKTTFENYKCFRLGGDEFVAICTNIDKDVFNDLVNTLRVNLAESDINLSIGVSYAAGSTVNMKKMLAEADKQMYEDKNKYYSDNNLNRRKEYE